MMADKRLLTALQIRKALEILLQAAKLSEDESISVPDLYELWAADVTYTQGRILKHGEDSNGDTMLFTVLQNHTSAANWPPGSTPALYKRIGFTEGGASTWVQPLGATDAYEKGDEVSHKEKFWVSDIDGNVWEPGVYGWREKQ
jgi:hypothetical protein